MHTAHIGLRRRLVGAALTGGLLAGLMAVGTHPAGAAPGQACQSRNNNTISKLLECVTVEGVREHQAALQAIADENDGTRSAGTPGYDASVAYARDRLEAAGYDVTVQSFEFDFFDDNSLLEQTAPNQTDYQVLSAQFDTPVAGAATGPLTPVDVVMPPGATANSSSSGCEATDFTTSGFAPGDVALLQRGTCSFADKALNAQAAGASAVVLYNEGQAGRTGFFVPIGPAPGLMIPVVATDFPTGAALFNADQAGTGITVHVEAAFISDTRTAANVIAETKGGDDSNVVMVGAHLDSVLDGPGINDNGSGAATVIDLAEAMRKVKPHNTVRFALWGAEEFGLLGSDFYVTSLSADEQANIALYLNFDMIASPNYVRFVYDGDGSEFGIPGPPGSGAIEQLFTQFYDDRGLASEETAFDGRSDYGPFIAVGIPSGGLFTGAEEVKTAAQAAVYGGTAGDAYDPCYHQACDTFANNDLGVLDLNADAVAFATFTYAQSTKSVDDAAPAAAITAQRVATSTFRDQYGEHSTS